MKKMIILTLSLVLAFTGLVCAESSMYSVLVSTKVLGQAGPATRDVVGISGIVRAKRIVLHQTTANAQYVIFYKNWTSTTAATEVFRYWLPATVGQYEPFGSSVLSTALGNYDILNMPNFAVRQTDTDVTHAVWINLLYGDK